MHLHGIQHPFYGLGDAIWSKGHIGFPKFQLFYNVQIYLIPVCSVDANFSFIKDNKMVNTTVDSSNNNYHHKA